MKSVLLVLTTLLCSFFASASLTAQSNIGKSALDRVRFHSPMIESNGSAFQPYDLTMPVIRPSAPAISDGNLDPTFNVSVTEGTGWIQETAIQSDGKIIAVGTFHRANGIRVNGIARFNADGSYDSSFNTGGGASAVIRTVAIQPDGKILIGGAFTTFNGQSVPRIARLNTDGTLDNTFTSGVTFSSTVWDIAVLPDSKILVGGQFNYNGTRLVRLNSNGSVDTVMTGAVGSVFAIALAPLDKILIGGDLGIGPSRIRRLNSDGTADSSFNPGSGPSSTVFRIVLQPDGKILAGGAFVSYNGTATDGLVRINDNGSLDLAFDQVADPNISNLEMFGLALQSDGKFIAGYFYVDGLGFHGVVTRFNSNGSVDQTFAPGDGDGGEPTEIRIDPNGKILVGGLFVQYNSQTRLHLTRLNSDGANDQGFTATASTMGNIRKILALPDGKYLLGGDFGYVNGIRTRSNLVRINPDGSVDSSFQTGLGIDGFVYSLFRQSDGKILVGNSLNILVRIDQNGGLDQTFAYAPVNNFAFPIVAIGMQLDGKIILGGSVFGSAPVAVMRLNAGGTEDTGFTTLPLNNGNVRTILVQPDDKILIGGTFITSGSTRFNLARLNADGTLNSGFSTNPRFTFDLQQQADGKILAGAITRYSSDGVVDGTLNVGTGFNNQITSIIPRSDGKILAGGYFTTYNGSAANSVVRLNSNGSIDNTFSSGSGTTGATLAMAEYQDGRLLVGGQFYDWNGVEKFSLVRLLSAAPRRTPFDFDGDGKTDVGVFRPNGGTGGEWWIQRSSNSSIFATTFGASTDTIAPGDFTGDGKTDVAFFRPSTGQWFVLRSEDQSFFGFPFGANGDVPMPADYDGDGKTDAAVYRPSSSRWFVLRSSDGGVTSANFGVTGDKPVAADYDGDGKADIAIFRPNGATGGEWWVLRSSNGSIFAATFGTSTDKPVQGDYTGDGKADCAFFRPSTGFWYVLRSEDQSFFGFPFGTNGDTLAPGDYDGDGKFDAAVFRQPGAQWFVNKSSGGVLSLSFGVAGDVPVPGAFVR